MTATTTGKMNPEIKQLWVDALRSGDYNQTTGVLHDGFGYCCLGVLCDLAVKAGVVSEVDPNGIAHRAVYDGADLILPNTVREWAGLESSEPGLPNGDLLTELNDERRESFKYIAYRIERGL